MYSRVKSLYGNIYCQVFSNKSNFVKIYLIDKKSKAGDSLKIFCREFAVLDNLTFDRSKEKYYKGTIFMKLIRFNDIKHHIIEPNFYNQNLVEGVIREKFWKWYRVMIRKRVPQKLLDYGIKWVSNVSSMTHTSEGGLDRYIPIISVTGETIDISEYLDFGFYDQVWYRDNAGLGYGLPGRFICVTSTYSNLIY